MAGSIDIVGLGPGSLDQLSPAAASALAGADLIVGYTPYLKLLGPLAEGKECYSTGMLRELERAAYALSAARRGRVVAVVGSGDACVYGLGGLVLELMEASPAEPPVRIHPGITAANAAAALLGAPLMNDYMVLSLSDLLTEQERILRRVDAACAAGIAVALYNPRSRTRTELFGQVLDHFLRFRSPETPAGIVRKAFRTGQESQVCTLGELRSLEGRVDMNTIVIIADETSVIRNGRIITPRGYDFGHAERVPAISQQRAFPEGGGDC